MVRKFFFFTLLLQCIYFSLKVNSQNINWVPAVNQYMSADLRETPVFRLPIIVVCNNGDVVVGCEAKAQDNSFRFYAISQSTDGGKSFKARRSEIPMAELVYDKVNDRLFSYAYKTFYASDNHGSSWYDYGSKLNIIKPDTFDVISMVPTCGIQLRNNILAIPLRFIRYKRDYLGKKTHQTDLSSVFILYSKDFGKTWEQSPMTPIKHLADEATIVEFDNNQIMINARGGTEYFWDATHYGRRVFVSAKKSQKSLKRWKIDSWILDEKSDGLISDPICHASLIRVNWNGKTIGLFCNPDMPDGKYTPRENLCLKYSSDFERWRNVCSMTPKNYPVWGYSSMSTNDNIVLFAYDDKSKGILVCNLSVINDILENLTKKSKK